MEATVLERTADLRRGELRYRSLIEATSAIVWSTPGSGEFAADQPGWSGFTGQSFEQLALALTRDALLPEFARGGEAAGRLVVLEGTQPSLFMEHPGMVVSMLADFFCDGIEPAARVTQGIGKAAPGDPAPGAAGLLPGRGDRGDLAARAAAGQGAAAGDP